MKISGSALDLLLGLLFYGPTICHGSSSGHGSHALLPLTYDVPMGHPASAVEFRIKKIRAPVGRIVSGAFRLPKSISPIHYDLAIRPIIDDEGGDHQRFTAPGTVTIRVKCLNATNLIKINAKWINITFSDIKINNLGNSAPVQMTGFNYDTNDTREFFSLFLNSDLTKNGEYLVIIPFQSKIASPDDPLTGIYRTSYLGSDGTEKTLITTQFQKAHAREAFPCFDEPSNLFKATFSVKIGRKLNYMSLSNMDKVGVPEPIDDLPGWVWDTYEKTIKLPVYSIGFALASDYVAEASPPNISRVAIKTWVPKTQLTNTSVQFSAKASVKIMNFFEELFDLPYPGSKLENLATPMRGWGMEHLGLITFRPILLLWQTEDNTQFEKWNSLWMIAHEYAHMWFGNLVTCDWWNDFWLNEGFARYFQFVIGKDESGEDFRASDRFVIDVVQWAMLLDAGPESVPVHRTDMERVYYAPYQIDYEKAAALIRMMETFLTRKTFFSGLKVYLKQHQLGTTVQDDLFLALNEQALIDRSFTRCSVKEVMDTWTKLKGFPLVRVSKADNDTIYVSQHRFVYQPSYHTIESGLWYVPIWYITKSKPYFDGNNAPPQFWMDKDTIITYFRVSNTNEWIVVNPEARGYYRVIYDEHLTNLIIHQLASNHTVFDCQTRSQLIDDFFKASQARYINIHNAMDITKYLHKEDDLIVWTTALNNLRSMYTRLIDTDIITQFRKYILSIVIPPLKRLGVKQPPNDTPSNIMLRGQLLDWACALKHKLCVHYAEEMIAGWMHADDPEEGNPVPTDYQPQIYCAAVACCLSHDLYYFFIGHYRKTKSWRQKNLVIRALTCDDKEGFLETLLNRTVDVHDTEINIWDHGELLLENLVLNTMSRSITWNFVKENHEQISKIHGSGALPMILNALVPYASYKGLSRLSTEVTSFIADYTKARKGGLDETTVNSLQKSAHKIVENSYWMEYNYNDLKDWLALHVPI